MTDKVRVLVVDDSAFMRMAISKMLKQAGITVIGTAQNGQEALEKIRDLKPDVVTLDVEMPVMDGLTALAEIMIHSPVPVIMLSSLTTSGAPATVKALELGAVDFVPKPASFVSYQIADLQRELADKIREAARLSRQKLVDIVRRRRRLKDRPKDSPRAWTNSFDLVAIGCSTGGPPALQSIVPRFPRDIPVGIVIAQHMPPGFTGPLAERLNEASPVEVREARSGDVLEPGLALVAPAGYQLRLERLGGRIMVRVNQDPSNALYKPSVDILMASAAEACGSRTVAVILTGMGSDGMYGMKAVYDQGGMTIAESEETCVVFGMPRKAIENGAIRAVLPLDAIADEILAVL